MSKYNQPKQYNFSDFMPEPKMAPWPGHLLPVSTQNWYEAWRASCTFFAQYISWLHEILAGQQPGHDQNSYPLVARPSLPREMGGPTGRLIAPFPGRLEEEDDAESQA
ncbi:hypothetical protein AS026_37480 [Rhizobium altiplani]|uniref:Uncharacterized protein n=1 Tax=Rhizobium altiplani TaxID=1864509 RepID=A0A120FNQ2_9HYPH|nr:hypothetical protein [Rhizobium altiplani]KWV55731.1 hypothetical protein AS026_37480 [Rhizobium altiplani]